MNRSIGAGCTTKEDTRQKTELLEPGVVYARQTPGRKTLRASAPTLRETLVLCWAEGMQESEFLIQPRALPLDPRQLRPGKSVERNMESQRTGRIARMARGVAGLVGIALLAGCATTVPEHIARAPAADPSLAEVRADPAAYQGRDVRWGGTIVEVENAADESRLEIIARPLRRGGRPEEADASPGRFIALLDDFIDPAIFAEGRDVTVFGTVAGEREGRIGERAYRYPVIEVRDHVLWQPIRSRDYPPVVYRGYYFHDPWYYPWGSYYRPPRGYYRPLPPTRQGILRR